MNIPGIILLILWSVLAAVLILALVKTIIRKCRHEQEPEVPEVEYEDDDPVHPG